MGDAEGGVMSRRVKIIFEDGEKTYGDVDTSGEKPIIVTGGMPYDLESFTPEETVLVRRDETGLIRGTADRIVIRPGVSASGE